MERSEIPVRFIPLLDRITAAVSYPSHAFKAPMVSQEWEVVPQPLPLLLV